MKKKKNFITIAVIIILLAGGIFLGYRFLTSAQRANAAANTYQTETAATGELTSTIGETGSVRARQSAVLAWNTSGTVETIYVDEMDNVARDDVLAELAYTSLSQSILQAQSDLLSAQTELDDLYLNFDRDKAEAQLAVITAQEDLSDLQEDREWLDYPRCNQDTIDDYQDEYQDALDRVDDLEGMQQTYPDNPSIRDALSSARSARDTAYANYNYCISPREESEINEADTEIALAQAKLDLAQQEYEKYSDGKPDADALTTLELRIKAAEATLAMAKIDAPFSGTVTAIDMMPGDQVNAGSSALRMDDLSELLVDVQVSEIDINSIHVGQDVIFTFDAIPGKEYHGQVTEIASVGDTVQGVVEFDVTTSILDFDEALKPGMTAVAEIVIEELYDVLLLPNQAVRVADGQRVVYILTPAGNVKQVVVELGAQSLYYSQVTGGDLEAGDEIILNPPESMLEFGPGGGSPMQATF